MAVNRLYVDAPPTRVFAVLSDPDNYADWVVGSRKVRGADDEFPRRGSRFYHQVGKMPFVISDETEVLESDPPRRLVLMAKVRPIGKARIELTLEPDGKGTHVTMEETAGDARSVVLMNRLTDPLMHARNTESLKRLRRLAEDRRS